MGASSDAPFGASEPNGLNIGASEPNGSFIGASFHDGP